jgi:exopolysaccharide biosynthesis polyprenyl glycosylphosphotransferase
MMIASDGMVIFFAFLVAYFIRDHFSYLFGDPDTYKQASGYTAGAAAVFLWCAMLYWNGMYRSIRIKPFMNVVWIIFKSAFFTFLAYSVFLFLTKSTVVGRLLFGVFLIISTSLIMAEKFILFVLKNNVRSRGYNLSRVLIVGTGRRAHEFIKKVKDHSEWGIKILGAIDDEPTNGKKNVAGIDIIGTADRLVDILHARAVDEVVFVVPRSRLPYMQNYIYDCEIEGIKATVAVDLFEARIAQSHLREMDGSPFLTFETTLAREWQLFIKRFIDVILSAFAIIILSPLYLLVALLIKMDSKGPAFFIQKRVGLNGRKFLLFKFRTMYIDAQQRQVELEKLNMMKGPVFKVKNDPRVTRVGKILRKLSIDELPQLFNVLQGEMSLVGPRPPLPKEVVQYDPWQRRRLSMRPGLTCLWQVSGRNSIDFNQWMKLDLEYLDKWCLRLDFKIIVKTIPVVLLGVGAY